MLKKLCSCHEVTREAQFDYHGIIPMKENKNWTQQKKNFMAQNIIV